MLLWGHVHQEFDCRRHNLRMLATPSTCFQFVVRDGNEQAKKWGTDMLGAPQASVS
ncbi:cAMP phosphodiesterase [Bordetella pertussis]|nr:cAMP phosphodiesterase [Bordetella pertussis]